MAEGVGIGLAFLSLIISVPGKYKTLAKTLRAFKYCSERMRSIRKELDVQVQIFLQGTERLLIYCVRDEVLAQRILAGHYNKNWHDLQLEPLVLERLRNSRGALDNAIELIVEQLSQISDALEKFTPPVPTRSKTVKNRIRYMYKEPDLEEAIKSLTRKIHNFTTLVDGCIPRESRMTVPLYIPAAHKELDHFSRIQETSADLYRALEQACTKHTSHQAHIRLEPICCETIRIKFAIGFSNVSLSCSPNTSLVSTWLRVESSIPVKAKFVEDERSSILDINPPRRGFSGDACLAGDTAEEAKKNTIVQKRIQFQLPERFAKVITGFTHQIPPLINLLTGRDFCDQLRKFLNQSQPRNDAVGFLDLSGQSKHLVYVDSKLETIRRISNGSSSSCMTTLCEIFTQPTTSLAMGQRFSLAKQLAKGLLQLHTTPWLNNLFDSRGIFVTTITDAEEESLDLKAFVTTKIGGVNNQLFHMEVPKTPFAVRNRLTLSLGIILLELAFQKPLKELMIEQDRVSTDTEYSNLVAADRLSGQVSRYMGAGYAEVTRKCIHCDFGRGFDLGKAELRAEFYREVVYKLEKMESDAKGLQ